MKEENPLLSAFNTPFHAPPFEQIKNEHYLPAFIKAIAIHKAEIRDIAESEVPADFNNTIAALDQSGMVLKQTQAIFYNLLSAHTNNNLQEISKEVAPMLSKHQDEIYQNEALFRRIKKVYDNKDKLKPDQEQANLIEEIYKDFARNGALLSINEKKRLSEINSRLALLSLEFGDNILAENNGFKLVIDKKDNLAGLPKPFVDAAYETATSMNNNGKWVFTIHKPSLIPFLQYAENRALREKMFTAYIMKGDHNDSLDNKQIIAETIRLRDEKAKLLGYENHADYVLEKNMAGNTGKVYDFLNQMWEAALPVAQREVDALQKMIEAEGKDFKLKPWDWWYFAEKLRKEKYDLDENELRPYFQLENVKKGIFSLCKKLYGLEFKEVKDVPKYHKDVHAYEINDADGSHVGLLYLDFFPRASKGSGAWMTSYRKQFKTGNTNVPPIISIVCNFTKPTGNTPSLLSLDEVLTFFHEFGHGLHGLLSDCRYYKTSGTSVARDFVELPSQIMENWALEPEVLEFYAFHYKTGKVIPKELVEKIQNARLFNQGFETIEYLAASILDMDWHTREDTKNIDVNVFEKQCMSRINLIPEIVPRYRSTYFAHIFSGGYSSGYYSYYWAAVLDADAYQAFKETSLFDPNTANAFRHNILEKGGTKDAMELYVAFRGKEPDVSALLKRKGLAN